MDSKNDEFITFVGEALKELDARAIIDNTDKLNELYEVEEKIRGCVEKPARIKSEVGVIFKRFGSVSVIAPEVVVSDTESFAACTLLADNVDIYPLANNTITIDFGFNQIMLEKEDGEQC